MQIDYLSVFEKLKDKDILYGGNNNLAIKREIEPYINHEDENEDLAYKYLLVQYEFYIFHALHCMDLIMNEHNEEEMLAQGYSGFEIGTARTLLEQYGASFEKKEYLYAANMKMGLVAHTICLMMENKPLNSIPIDIVESAEKRMAYANEECQRGLRFRS